MHHLTVTITLDYYTDSSEPVNFIRAAYRSTFKDASEQFVSKPLVEQTFKAKTYKQINADLSAWQREATTQAAIVEQLTALGLASEFPGNNLASVLSSNPVYVIHQSLNWKS